MLRIRNLTRRFGPIEALCELDLDVKPGERLALRGPGGCHMTHATPEHTHTKRTRQEADGRSYEPPELTLLGTVEEITQANIGANTDMNANNPGSVSDRNLKQDFVEIDVREVLARVALMSS